MNSSYSKYTIAILLLLAICSPHGMAQIELYDSLVEAIDTLDYEEKVDKLSEAAILFEKVSMQRSLHFANERAAVVEILGNDSLIAENNNLIGNIYLESELLEQAEKYYKISYNQFKAIDNYHGCATETHNLGLIHFMENDTLKALDYFEQSIDARMRTGDNRRIGDGLTTLGEVYMKYGYHEKSISLLTEAVEYYSDLKSYPRKYQCYGFLADNFMVIDQSKVPRWINEMQSLYSLDTTNPGINKQSIIFRRGKYYIAQGEVKRAASEFNKLDLKNYRFQSEFNYIETFRELSQKLYQDGQIYESLRYSEISRNLSRFASDTLTWMTISSFNSRLNLISREEEITRTEELNAIILKRLNTEVFIKYTMYVVILVLLGIGIGLLSNFMKIRRAQTKLSKRKLELENAYEKNILYKESILNLKENKNIFFNIISSKLSAPFSVMTDQLSDLSDSANIAFNKDEFLVKLNEVYEIAISVERSLKRILLWSKLQREQYHVDKEQFYLSDYLHEILPEILKMSVKKSIKIRYDIDSELMIKYDRSSLKSILKVFIENSIDNSEKGSDIIIRGQRSSKGSIISVTDFGNGIPEKLQNNIFDVNKVDQSGLESNPNRLGLGLLLANHVSSLNNSHITFESIIKGGTTFYIHIKK